jgi:KaiC/GvpD/RAD55 family RecA-like ATPase/tetratricopeptide (TPR) repeat protein
LHWADSASLALVHYISRWISSNKVLFIATFRSEELSIDASGRTHPLAKTLRLMRREDLFKQIQITSLKTRGIYDLAKNMLGGELHSDFAGKLTKESQGNPLFIVESIRMLYEQNSLINEHGNWLLIHSEVGIPTKIKDIILLRLDSLTINQRRFLDAASIIGERFSVELLSSILGLDSIETIKILDNIAEQSSIVTYQKENYKFDHARSRDTIYNEISPALRKSYHNKVGEELEKISKDDKLPYSDLAYHFAKAQNRSKAVNYSLAAGKEALLRWSTGEAIKHLAYVVEVLGEDSEIAENKLIALEALGDAFYAHELFDKATSTFLELSNIAKSENLKLKVLRKAIESVSQQKETSKLNTLVTKAKKYAKSNRLEYAKILIIKGRAFALNNNISAALKDFQNALQVFEEEYSLWDVAWTLVGVGAFQIELGMKQEGITTSLLAISLLEELDLESRWPKEEYYVVGTAASFNISLLEKVLEEIQKIRQEPKEGVEHAYIKANMLIRRKLIVNEEFEIHLDLINIGKKEGFLYKIENLLPTKFKVTNAPSSIGIKNGTIDLRIKQIKGFHVETVKITLQPAETGEINLNPHGVYTDDLGETKEFRFNPVSIKIKPSASKHKVAPNRITSGFDKLDNMLMGGIPEKIAIALTGSPSDERQIIINKFLEAGINKEQTTFHITTEVTDLVILLEKPNFYLFLCNPKPKVQVPDLPNIVKFRSKTDINNLNIALARINRNLTQKQAGKKRMCIEIVSDVLLRHGPEVTRRWLSELITEMIMQGFTILVVLNPKMHPADQVNAVLDLLDGEINLYETQDQKDFKKYIQVKKLRNLDYMTNPIFLSTQK